MWKPGDVIAWRGIFNQRPWHVQSVIVVKDSLNELVVCVLPGAESVAEKTYNRGKKEYKRRWEFEANDWELMRYSWHTNRVLAITQPEEYYSTMLFWNEERNEFLGYYVNFQLPFTRSHCGIDTLDLDLDIDIEPDLTFRWKDEHDYQQSVEHGVISLEWVREIENAKPEILNALTQRLYPYDGAWLDWMPNRNWSLPKLPENWDKI